MKNSKGFTLIEVLVAMSIILMLVATIVPINTFIQMEKKVLHDRRVILFTLHDELQDAIWQDEIKQNKQLTINHQTVEFNFSLKNKLIKGCASWKNEKQKEETVCLYGHSEK